MAKLGKPKPTLHTRKHLARLERERRQTRLILFSFIGIMVAVFGLLVYGYVDVKYLQARRPVARVGEANISVGEWQARVRLQRSSLINQMLQYQQISQSWGIDLSAQIQQFSFQLNSPTTLGQSVLDQMINEELIRQEAARRHITASREEVDQAIQASYGYFPNGTPTPTMTPTEIPPLTLSPQTLALVTLTPTPTQAATETPLPTPSLEVPASTASATAGPTPSLTPTSTPSPTATPYTLQAFEENYKLSLDSLAALGLSEAQVRALYEVRVLEEKLFAVLTADVPHVQEQVWARHILVADEATAAAVRQRLLGGEDFAVVAREVSIDPSTKEAGGDLGWFSRGRMVPEFEQAAFSLKIGEISQPVKSQYGYHILQVLGHQENPLDASAYEQARQKAFQDWLAQARQEYKVVTYDIWQGIVPTEPAVPTPAP